MGEIGHNTEAWQNAFCHVMEENNIGWTFWPYKKIDKSSFAGIKAPAGWTLSLPSPKLPGVHTRKSVMPDRTRKQPKLL